MGRSEAGPNGEDTTVLLNAPANGGQQGPNLHVCATAAQGNPDKLKVRFHKLTVVSRIAIYIFIGPRV